ncbi:MAG: hypothetical protein HC849_19350 [Oscillatoriales cyanobacterium RU_3_3]|nr:hypothetical protein [Oscillatoriales cyanobacterium RU_3_3]
MILDFRLENWKIGKLGDWENYQLPTVNCQLSTLNYLEVMVCTPSQAGGGGTFK